MERLLVRHGTTSKSRHITLLFALLVVGSCVATGNREWSDTAASTEPSRACATLPGTPHLVGRAPVGAKFQSHRRKGLKQGILAVLV